MLTTDPRLTAEQREVAEALIADGIAVSAYVDPRRVIDAVRFFVIERAGNVGSVSREGIFYPWHVSFAIKPSRETGSGLLVADPETGEDPWDAAGVVRAARLATGERYGNFATPGRTLPNHGPEHFAWSRERLAPLTLA